MWLAITSPFAARPIATAIIANIRLTAVPTSQNHIAILRRLRFECPFVPTPPIISQSEFGPTANVGYDGMKKSTIPLSNSNYKTTVYRNISEKCVRRMSETTRSSISPSPRLTTFARFHSPKIALS